MIYSPRAQQDALFWKKSGDFKVLKKITTLLLSIEETPFEGTGKPEALKYELSGYWSRRITKEHRIVYRALSTDKIEIISMRFHY